jgi:hypothetical protein
MPSSRCSMRRGIREAFQSGAARYQARAFRQIYRMLIAAAKFLFVLEAQIRKIQASDEDGRTAGDRHRPVLKIRGAMWAEAASRPYNTPRGRFDPHDECESKSRVAVHSFLLDVRRWGLDSASAGLYSACRTARQTRHGGQCEWSGSADVVFGCFGSDVPFEWHGLRGRTGPVRAQFVCSSRSGWHGRHQLELQLVASVGDDNQFMNRSTWLRLWRRIANRRAQWRCRFA